MKERAGYCRACQYWSDELRCSGRSSVLAALGYTEECKRAWYCPLCFEQMEEWTNQIRLKYGKKRFVSAVSRARKSAAQTGKRLSDEHRARISQGMKGVEHNMGLKHYLTADELAEGKVLLLQIMAEKHGVSE